MTEQKPLKEKVLIVAKWIFSITFFIAILGALSDKAYLSAIAFLLLGLLLLPPLKEFLTGKVALLSNRPIKFGLCFLLFVGAAAGLPKSSSKNSAKVDNSGDVKAFEEDEVREGIMSYVNSNKTKPVIKNMELLTENYCLFNDAYKQQWSFTGVLILNEKERSAMFQPFIGENLNSTDFLKGDTITEYRLRFFFDNQNKVKSVEAIVYNGTQSKIWTENDSTDLSKFLLAEKIAQQKLLAEEREKQRVNEAQKKKRNEEFKESCLSSWDGSCPALERYLKKYLKDPKSYEHIETGFWNMGDYAVVLTKYRAKNSFGGYNIGYIKAKVSWDCEVTEIIENGNM